jgi:hypothetical protein
MAFKEGHTKIGGRKKGTPNKKTLIRADELLLQLNINPIQKLIELAESDEATIDHKINCYKEIAKYTYPKHRSQDISLNQTNEMPGTIQVRIVKAVEESSVLNNRSD